MSYEGTTCNCGGKKAPDTLICTGCEAAYADHPAMAAYKDKSKDVETRRHAAHTLLTLAGTRKRSTDK